MKPYEHKEIEKKWQDIWEKEQTYKALDPSTGSGQADTSKQKYYALMEFPYPSGDGLHTGHVRGYTAMDIISRKRRAQGYNVLFPIGWDAFGLPTENFAIKTGLQPAAITQKNTDTFRKQFKSLGMSFDWSREINTTDPKYYKWTQWIFLQFLKAGLAYKAKAVINWCPKDKIGLANEEVIDGKCERCGTVVEKREKEQWMLAITKYADRLDKDLDTVDYLPQIKAQQRNWIGRSEGVEINFRVDPHDLPVFTTRPDTIFGVTFIAVSAELAKSWVDIGWLASDEIKAYITKTLEEKAKDGFEIKEKTGISAGFGAVSPATKKEVPIWITNYVLGDVGTGAIMGVPADDERDREFAEKYDLPIVTDYEKAGFEDFGKKITRFKLRDWVFSRQRYWGEPIPVIHCEKCGYVPVPDDQLPVTLPEVEKYEPTDNGESPLASIESWVNTECPTCGGAAKRETDTMPNWAGSSWYYLRYTDPHNDTAFASQTNLKYWLGTPKHSEGGVDWYNGGMEHTTLHLLYSRFWHKFLFDQGFVPTSEPYAKRTSHGLILAEGGVKMSKSKGNVVNPDTIVDLYGADTLRVYEMFMGPFTESVAWSTESIIGPRRFLERIWRLQEKVGNEIQGSTLDTILNQTIQKVSDDIESMSFNTAVSSLMICLNAFEKFEAVSRSQFEMFLQLLSPFAPHISEELFQQLGNSQSIQTAPWPKADISKLTPDTVTIAIQVNSKVRGTVLASPEADEDSVKALALALGDIQKWINGEEIEKVIYVKGRLLNLVLKV